MKVKVSIALEKDLVKRIDRVAAAIGAKRSGVVQRWIERQIEEAELLAGLYGDDAARIFYESPHLKGELLEAIRKAEAGPDSEAVRKRRRKG